MFCRPYVDSLKLVVRNTLSKVVLTDTNDFIVGRSLHKHDISNIYPISNLQPGTVSKQSQTINQSSKTIDNERPLKRCRGVAGHVFAGSAMTPPGSSMIVFA